MADSMHIAVLIDSENISAHYISAILDEVAAYGIASVRRIYGDWTSPHAVKWKDALLDSSLTPMQQFGNTSHKNSTDSAMIIDAMDILYSGDVNGYCIVSSDSDFTRLASRLRESGALVLGMGEEKTPLSFRKACTKFVTLENLIKSDETRPQESVLDVSKIERTVSDIIVSNEGLGKRTRLSGVGNELSNKYSDFDVRNYGYSSLSRFLDEMPRFDLVREGNDYLVTLSRTAPVKEAVTDLIRETLIEAPHQEMGLSELGNIVRNQFSDFDQRDYGYTQFSKFVASIKGVQIVHSEGNRQSAALDTQA